MSDTHDPIRPAHYRDDTGRDRIDVWREAMTTYEFVAAIGATVDRYVSRAGRKPGVSAEQDRAKAAEVARRFFEEWGEGADELLGEFLGDLGHDREAIDDLLLDAARPRTPTPPAEVTPQQAAGALPLPVGPGRLVLGNGDVAMTIGTVEGESHSRMLMLYRVEPGPIGHRSEVGARPSELPEDVSVMPDDPRLDVLIYCGRRESAEMLRDTVQQIIDEWPCDGWQQPPAAQDDHAAALQRERERADRAERERDDALRSLGRLVAKDAELARRAAHAALTAQRSDDTARDDGSAAGEGEVAP